MDELTSRGRTFDPEMHAGLLRLSAPDRDCQTRASEPRWRPPGLQAGQRGILVSK
jgi:hypothetical protein